MEKLEFSRFRKRLNKTQRQLAQLLGVSIKAVQGYEQGWRSIPVHVERQMFFLLTRMEHKKKKLSPCWEIMDCPQERKMHCPAWEFQVGSLCWFINGTICHGRIQKNWDEKIKICRKCPVLESVLSR